IQCAIPAFGGLLDNKNNEVILNLLFELATWHALAKLRLHTESTVCELELSTTRLGRILRKFAKSTCEEFATFDLPSEEAARGRRTAARATRNPTGSTSQTTSKGKQKATQHKTRKFNMCTYKMHALGDYARCIRLFGETDGYSTQTVHISSQSLYLIFSPPGPDRASLNTGDASAFTPGSTRAKDTTSVG
ncbi:hypothetical protein H4582DRAFT_1803835, partial [Lactarius indigo]